MKLILVFALLTICYAGTVPSQEESPVDDAVESDDTVEAPQERAVCDTACMLRRLEDLMYTSLGKKNCPIGYQSYWPYRGRYPTKCYKYSNQKVSWYTAMTRCHEDGGHLATVYSYWEARFLQAMINHQKRYGGPINSHGAWLGATDRLKEGTFIWEATGGRLNYKNFRPNEPNNYKGNEDCVYMSTTQHNQKWNDLLCSHKINYICQKNLF